jgi:exoribonuclease-2
MDAGTVIEFIEVKRIMCGVCLGEKPGKVHVLTENNREMSLPLNRIINTSTDKLGNLSRSDMVDRLREIIKRREQLKERITADELWDLLHKENKLFDARSIAELCFDSQISSDHVSAVIRSLFEDKIYFKFKGGHFLPNTPQVVEQILVQKEKEKEKERYLEKGSKWLSAVWEGRDTREPENLEEYVSLLKQVAVFGKDSPGYERGRELLSRAGLHGENDAFNLLVRMGVFGQDENLLLHYHQIPTQFPPQAIEEGERLCNSAITTRLKPGSKRKDLRDFSVITIDRWGTRDHDDGLSIQRNGDEYHVGVHIADVSHYISLDSYVDKEAQTRGISLYLPDMRIPMLPEGLSEQLLSLREGRNTAAMSILVDLDTDFSVISYEIHPSVVSVSRRLNYKEVEDMVKYDPDLRLLHFISQGLARKRMDQGALSLPIPEIHIYADPTNKQIKIEKIDPQSKARTIVSELMIFANQLSAHFVKNRGIPAIYRSQEQPRANLLDGKTDSLFMYYKQRRLLNRAELGIVPKPHSTLGIDAYTTISSPIRRYLDLIVQRQIMHALRQETLPYAEEQLRQIAIMLEEVYRRTNLMKQSRIRYWLLRYLESRVGQKTQAVVLENFPSRHQLLLIDYLLEIETPSSKGPHLVPGDNICVEITSVNARENMIKVALC